MPTRPVDAPPSRNRRPGLGILIAAGALLVLGALVPAPARAQRQDDAKVFMHLVPHDEIRRRNCFAHGARETASVVTEGALPEGAEPARYYAYVMIADVDTTHGIAGIQFGITYDGRPNQGVDVLSWVDCGLYEWAQDDWPQAGSGNLITWHQQSDCQVKNPIVVGFFDIEVHSPDQFRIIPRPADGKLALATCGIQSTTSAADRVTELREENMGWAGFGGKPGYNPWNPEEYRARTAASSPGDR